MDLLANLFDLLLHVDQHLTAFVAEHGAWVYLLLIVIIFAETGLVVAPWLPGDSLLFVVGTLAGLGSIDYPTILLAPIAASFCGAIPTMSSAAFSACACLRATAACSSNRTWITHAASMSPMAARR